MNRATGAGVMNWPSADFRLSAIPTAITRRALSACSSFCMGISVGINERSQKSSPILRYLPTKALE